MSFNTALSSDQLETLRGTDLLAPYYAGSVNLSLCPNDNVYTARVNQASFAASFAQITFDGGSGTLADIVPGMTVLISPFNDRSKAVFVGRVRKSPTSSILYINETSGDIDDNDYIFILDDFKIWDKLGKEVSGVLKHDYDIGFRQLPPVIYGLKSAYADNVDSLSEVYEITFEPNAVAATSGATISSWDWDVGDGTIKVGSSSTQTITTEFPEGFRHVYLTVTDDGGRTAIRKIPVWAHSDNYPPQLLGAGNFQVTANVASGVDATVTAFAGVDSILDNTLVVAWTAEEIYQDATGSLMDDNILFVGRFRRHSDITRTDELASLDSERQYTIEGPLTQLARIEQLPYEMLNKATPTKFGQIKDMTLWRGIVYLLAECSTFLDLHSLRIEDTTNTYLAPTRNPVGNILNAVNDLAGSVDSALQMNFAGESEIVLDLRMGTTGQRASAVVVADWDARDILDIQYDHAHVRTVGRLKATGGSYNSVSDLYNTFESLAPGVAQDYPEGTGSLDRQVLASNVSGSTAQAQLNARAGHAFERAQEVDSLTVTFPDGYYGVLIPALNQWHTFTIDDDAINVHLDSNTRWLLTEVNITHNSAEGTKEVRAVFNRETAGLPGQTVTYPAVAEVVLTDPVALPFPSYPMYPPDPSDVIGEDPVIITTPLPGEIPTDGNAVVVGTASVLLVVVNPMLTTTPGTRDVTPADLLGTIRDGRFGAGKDFYLLSSDATTSKVYYTEDIFAGEVAWTEVEVDGEYSELEKTATQGEAYIYSLGSGEWCHIFDFTVNNGGFTTDEGVYSPGVGWTGTPYGTGGGLSGLTRSFSQAAITSVTVIHTASGYGAYQKMIRTERTPDPPTDHAQSGPINGTNIVTQYLIPGDPAPMTSLKFFWDGADSNAMTITSIEVCGVGFNPFGSSVNATTRFTDDFAATFDDPEDVGLSAGVFGGLSTSKIGTQVFAGSDGQTNKASDGGVYSTYGSAHTQGAYFIPRYIFSSTSSGNTGSSPEYLLFSPDLDSGESMWRVTAGGNTFFDVTPIRSGTEGLAVGYRCIVMPWRSGSIIFAIAEFGGSVRRLCVSDDTGMSWTFSAALDQDAVALTTRKSDTASKQVFLTNGQNLGICFNAFAATPLVSDRNLGLTDNLIFVEVYG